MKSLRVVIICLISFLLSCNKASDSNDIKIHKNSSKPAMGNSKVDFDLVYELNLEEKGLIKPRFVTLDSENNLYVVETLKNNVYKFDSHGNFLFKFLEKGDGPGEIKDCGAINFVADTIVLSDYMTGKIVKFNKSGEYLSQKHYNNLIRFYNYKSLNNSGYIGYRNNFNPMTNKMKVSKEISLLSSSFEKNKSVNKQEYSTDIRNEIDFTYDSRFQVDTYEEKIYVSSSSSKEFIIEVFDFKGKMIEKILRQYIPIQYTNEDINLYEKIGRKYNPDYTFPYKYKQAITNIFCGNEGRIFVEAAKEKVNNIVFEIFQKGKFIMEIESPVPVEGKKVYFIKGDLFVYFNYKDFNLKVYKVSF